MAVPSLNLIQAIRKTTNNLRKGAPYQWGHMGSCNCGNLAQELTRLTKAEIHAYAMRKHGDWTDQLNDYCPSSNLPMDLMISEMLKYGLDVKDLKNLERLSDDEILQNIPGGKRYLKHNVKEDVITYLESWADLLEKKLLIKINISNLQKVKTVSQGV